MSDFNDATKAFEDWVSKRFSFVSSKFRIADLRANGEGRGLIATEDISKDEVLFELSRDAILNIDTASITKLRSENREILRSLNQWQALIICVAFEWFLGQKSEFLPYFQVLPLKHEDFNSLMFWSNEELKLLKPSAVLKRIGRDAAEEMYAILVADIIPEKLQCPELSEFLTEERFHIVASLIMSYSFDVDHPEEVEAVEAAEDNQDNNESHNNHQSADEEEEKEGVESESAEDGEDELFDDDMDEHENAEDDGEQEENEQGEDEIVEDPVSGDSCYKSMVPLADTLNSNTTYFNATLKYEKTKLVMIAEKDIKKGEQIYNIYGELPNSEILRKYGYVELPSSKFEFAEITLDDVKSFFESKFLKQVPVLKESQVVKLLEAIFEAIEESEYLEETLAEEMDADIVSDRYEIFANGEVLPEFLLLILITTSVLQAAESDSKWFKKISRSVERKPSSELIGLIERAIMKSHQLLEDKNIITQSTLENLNEIMKLRISQYPTHIIDGSYQVPETCNFQDRKELADVVLFNEVKCLKDVVDGKFPPKQEDGNLRFKIIEDEKFLKNLLKRKLEEDNAKATKKQKK